MSAISVAGDTSGSVTLQAPAVAGSTVLTLPATSGTVSTLGTALTSATTQASTSGTSIDFTGIPSWVKRITVMFSGVSINGATSLIVRIGDSTGFAATGYQGAVVGTLVSSSSIGASTTAYLLGGASASNQCIGSLVINLAGSNNWVASGTFYFSDTQMNSCAGAKTLSGALDRVRITTVNGTDAFDAGSINIMYE